MKTIEEIKYAIEEIKYGCNWCGFVRIPKGTKLEPASNLPAIDSPYFWACEWQGMSDRAKAWHRNYGFLIEANQAGP